MKIQSTHLTASTGIGLTNIGAKDWRHVDSSDNRYATVGPIYATKSDLLADHVPYLLRAGWLRLKVTIPEPILVFTKDGTSFAWQCDSNEIGIATYGDNKDDAIEQFKEAVTGEYGHAVTLTKLTPFQCEASSSTELTLPN